MPTKLKWYPILNAGENSGDILGAFEIFLVRIIFVFLSWWKKRNIFFNPVKTLKDYSTLVRSNIKIIFSNKMKIKPYCLSARSRCKYCICM